MSAYGRVKIVHRAFVRALLITAILFTSRGSVCAADKLRMAYVSPSITLSLPWVAKELGILAKHDLVAEILLITGSPRLVQSLISGDVEVVFAGVTALTRARIRGADVAILGAVGQCFQPEIHCRPELENPPSGRCERRDHRRVAVWFGSRHLYAERAGDGRTRPDRDVTILQLGGHPQVAAAMVAGKLDVGALAGLAALTAESAGARLLTSAVELEDSFSLGHLRDHAGLYPAQSNVVERLIAHLSKRCIFSKPTALARFVLLQKYFGGLNMEEAAYLYDEQVDLLERSPGPNDKALQAVLDRENDAKTKTFRPADFVDASFSKEIEKSGMIEQLYGNSASENGGPEANSKCGKSESFSAARMNQQIQIRSRVQNPKQTPVK